MSALLMLALPAAFVAGIAGGVHCAGMCGGIVHAMCGARGTSQLRFLFAYNAGRIGSYACAGLLVGILGQAGLMTRAAPVLQPLLFALASLMLVALGLYVAGKLPFMNRIEAAGSWLWRRIQPWTRHLLPVTSPTRALALGALWGWLPCGMVYAMLMVALTLGTWWQGAAVMAAFGLGTLPNLMGMGVAAARVRALRGSAHARSMAGIVIVVLGSYGFIQAALPAAYDADGFLCHVVPGLASWFN